MNATPLPFLPVSTRRLFALAGGLIVGTLYGEAIATDFPAVFQPNAAPAPSSVAVTISAPLVGESSDSSSLSGTAILAVGEPTDPFGFGQLVDVELVLDDGMDFSLLGGAVTVRADPGATRVRMIDPGPAGDVTNGQFDQLDNIFQFEGEIFLSTEEGPFDLSGVAPLVADLNGIQLQNQGNQLVANLTIDLDFTTAIAVPVLGQIPLTINIKGNLAAIALMALAGDFNGDGQLDAQDIDLLHAAIRTQSPDPQFDLNDDGQLNDKDSSVLVHDLLLTSYGDTNLDGVFESSDLVSVLQMGQYEDAIVGNSGWEQGDWSGDGDFDSGDLVLSMTDGCYESCVGPRMAVASVPEPATAILGSMAALLLGAVLRRPTSLAHLPG